MAIALLFPGQGSQAVGMGAELAQTYMAAREVFEEVDAALGQKLSDIMFNGPADALTLTENAQPALMAVSLAVMRVLEREKGLKLKDKVKFVAGHSLGEYSALAAVDAFSIADAARLLKLRGTSMQVAVPVGQGAMAALLGVGRDVGEALAAEAAQGEVCEVANDNEPTQVVISGAKTAIDRAGELAKKHGVRRFMPLNVSAPFHCALMQPAADVMADALSKVAIKTPAVPVVANVVAEAISDPADIKARLVQQVTGTVRWRECMNYMAAQGVTEFFELGSGKVLSGLAKRIVKDAEAISIGAPGDIDAAIARLRVGDTDSMFELKGKTALVTGATGGIGGAIARALHAQGAAVAISGRQVDKLEALAAELKERVHICPCDLASKEQVGKLVDDAAGKLGRVDILVNNAGLTKDNLFMVMKDEQWDDVIARQPDVDFHADARGRARHDAGQDRLRTYHQHLLDLRHHRQSRAGELCGLQSRDDRHDQVARARGRLARHNGQLHRARFHQDRHDRCSQREAGGGHQGCNPSAILRQSRGHCRRSRVSGQRGGPIHDRSNAACEWRLGDDLSVYNTAAEGCVQRWSTGLKCVNERRFGGVTWETEFGCNLGKVRARG